MTRKEKMELGEERKEILQQMTALYSGILFHNQEFAADQTDVISYHFDCPEFALLREKYGLEQIAGQGSDFCRAKRLLHYLAPRLSHCSWYDNHVPCNALDLLEYSLDNSEHGINCLNKSKILEECCLAVGIYARRVGIMPFSPYDFDNHVVTEIYDRKRKKWIMLDATSDGYFVDENKNPLSLLEMRDCFAHDRFVTFVLSTNRLTDLEKLRQKYLVGNMYICKNLFYFRIGKQSRFGQPDSWLTFCPAHYSIRDNEAANIAYRIHHAPAEAAHLVPVWEAKLQGAQAASEPEKTHISAMLAAPDGGKL